MCREKQKKILTRKKKWIFPHSGYTGRPWKFLSKKTLRAKLALNVFLLRNIQYFETNEYCRIQKIVKNQSYINL